MLRDERIAIIDGCRTPFLRSGGDFSGLMDWEIGAFALKGLVEKSGIDPNIIGHVIMGCLFHDIRTSNVARESVLGAGLPYSIPAHTCTVACISANMAVTNGAGLIALGDADAVIAGGVESFDLEKLPPIKEFSTDQYMGESGDRLARRLGISREEQDEYAVLSHQRAVAAEKAGRFTDEIVPALLTGKDAPISDDTGPRADTTIEKIRKLKGAFDREKGTVTAANASFLTDGATAILLMREDRAKALGFTPKAFLKSFTYTAQEPLDELLLGPAFAIPKLLDRTGLTLDDIGVFEMHEAFAVQMIANLRLLDSDEFARDRLGREGKTGRIDRDKLNIYGGSLSLGHPFAATGGRLITTCCNRMKDEGAEFGIVAGCAAGAVGSAILLENAG